MYNEYELIYFARCGDPIAMRLLQDMYHDYVRMLVRSAVVQFPMLKENEEDYLQEAEVCFMVSVRNYRSDQNAGFRTFINLVIRRRLLNAVRATRAKGRIPKDKLVNLDAPITEDCETGAFYPQANPMNEPDYAFYLKEALLHLNKTVHKMKPQDRQAVHSWASGETYREAAQRLGCSEKTYASRMKRVKDRIRAEILSENCCSTMYN